MRSPTRPPIVEPLPSRRARESRLVAVAPASRPPLAGGSSLEKSPRQLPLSSGPSGGRREDARGCGRAVATGRASRGFSSDVVGGYGRSVPDVVFVGVSTGQSLVHRVWPVWQPLLGTTCGVRGTDLGLGVGDEDYVGLLERLRNDESAAGAVITAHKVRVYAAGEACFAPRPALARLSGGQRDPSHDRWPVGLGSRPDLGRAGRRPHLAEPGRTGRLSRRGGHGEGPRTPPRGPRRGGVRLRRPGPGRGG